MNRFLSATGRILKAVKNGSLVLQLHLDKYFVKTVICIAAGLLAIWTSLLIDNTLTKVKRNNDIIKEQQEIIAIRTFQVSEINRRSRMEELLKQQGSKVCAPEKPAYKVK